MITIFLLLLLEVLIIHALFILSKSKIGNYLIELPSNAVRKFHRKKMIKIGGISFMPVILLLYYNDIIQINLIIFFSIIFIFIGLLSDINQKQRVNFRLLLMILFVVVYLIISENIIYKVNFNIIDAILSYHLVIGFLFTLLALLLLINAINLIDGLHGLSISFAIMYFTSLSFHPALQQYNQILSLFYILIYMFAVFGIYNFFTGKIRLGDCGSYFIGFLTGGFLIYIYNNYNINALYIASLVAFPIIELLYSYLRRISSGQNPFEPDQKHLHSLIYINLLNTNYFKDKFSTENINRFSSLLIIIFQAIALTIIHILPIQNFYYLFFIIFNIIIYLMIHTYLIKKII